MEIEDLHNNFLNYIFIHDEFFCKDKHFKFRKILGCDSPYRIVYVKKVILVQSLNVYFYKKNHRNIQM